MGNENFDMTVRSDPPYHVVALRGALDASSESAFCDALDPLCEPDGDLPPHILLDCMTLSYVNSATFGLFFHYHRKCESRNGRLVLCGMPAKIESIVKLLGLHQVLTIHSSLEEAQAAVSAEPSRK